MSDNQNRIPSFDEVMGKDTQNGKVPSFEDIMGEEPPVKKKVSGNEPKFGGIVGTYAPQSEESKIAKALQTVKSSPATEGDVVREAKYKAVTSPKLQVTQEEFDEDPVSVSRKVILSKMPSVKRYDQPKSAEQEDKVAEFSFKEGDKEIENVKKFYSDNTNSSIAHLSKITGISNPDLLYSDEFDERIKSAVKPGNETDRLAYERLQDAKKARAVVRENLEQGKSFEDMAIDYAAANSPEMAKVIQQLKTTPTVYEVMGGVTSVNRRPEEAFDEATIGRFLYDFYNSSAVRQEMEKIPGMTSKVVSGANQLIQKYPSFGKMYLGNLISQKMEDMGMNNAVLNVATKKERDKAVEALVAEDKMSPLEVQFYKDNIRNLSGLGLLRRKVTGNPIIDTPGALESAAGGAYGGFKNTIGGLYELTGLRESVLGSQGALRQDLEKTNTQVSVKPKGIVNQIAMNAGQFFGQSMSIGAGGKMINNIKLAKDPMTVMGMVGATQAYANYLPQARMMFPGNELKQKAYAFILSGIEWKTEKIFNDRKVVDGLLGKLKPSVVEAIKDFTEKKISSEAARANIQSAIRRAIKDTPEAAKYFGKAVVKNDIEELSAELGGQVSRGIFENKPFDEWIDGEDLYETTKAATLGSPIIGSLSARADMQKNRGITAKTIYSMAQDPDYWKSQIMEGAKLDETLAAEAPDKIKNLETAAKIVQELDATKLTEKQKVKYVITELEKQLKAEQSKDAAIQAIPKAAISELEKVQQDILDGKDDGSIEGDKSDDVNPDEKKLFDMVVSKAKEGYKETLKAAETPIEGLEYLEDKYAENPVKFREDFGDDIADKIGERTSTEKLESAIDFLIQQNPDDPAIPVLDKLISERTNPPIDQQRELDMGSEPLLEEDVSSMGVGDEPTSLRGVKYADIVVGDKRLEDILDDNKLSDFEKERVRDIFSRGVDYFKFDKEGEKKFQEKFSNPEDITDVADVMTGVSAAQQSAFNFHNEKNYTNVKDIINYIVNNPSEYSDKIVKAVNEIKQKLDNPSSSMNRLYAIDVMKELGIQSQSAEQPIEASTKPTVTTKETTPNIEDWSKDVESTAKALWGVQKENADKFVNDFANIDIPFRQKNIQAEMDSEVKKQLFPNEKSRRKYAETIYSAVVRSGNFPKILSEAYHKAKADGSNPELVKAVEELLGKPTEKQKTETTPTVSSEGVSGSALKDVESTAKALEGVDKIEINKKQAILNAEKIDKGSGSHVKKMSLGELNELARDMISNEKYYQDKLQDAQGVYNLAVERIQELSESYHKAKSDGSNPELVEAVEDLLGKAPTQYTEAATPKVEGGQTVETTIPKNETTQEATKATESIPTIKEPSAKEKATEDTGGAKEIAKKIRSLKVDLSKMGDGGLQSNPLGLPVAVWNGAMDIIATTVEAGGKVADAIKRGLNYIQKNHRGQWDKKGFNDQVMKELGVRGITVNGEDLVVKDVDKEFAETINGFYSDIEQSVLNVSPNDKGLPQAWIKKIGSGDEAKWTGVADWLNSLPKDQKVSRQEVLQWMKDNRIQVVEVVLGKDDYRNLPEYKEADQKAFEAANDKMVAQQKWWDSKKEEDYDEVQRLDKELDKWTKIKQSIEQRKEKEGVTKFSQYQLEGEKSNYKEVLVTLPYNTAVDKTFAPKFKSSHFEEPNILVHLRMNTRFSSDGSKILMLEEIQSDWQQNARKQGIRNEQEMKRIGELADLFLSDRSKNQEGTPERVEYEKLVAKNNPKGVPDAPFIGDTNSTTKLAFKVALKEAIAQGADKMAWSTGTQQFDRWGSEEISWRKNTARTPQEETRMKELGEKIVNYKDTDEERVEHEKLARKEGGFSLLINEQTSGAIAFNGQESGNKDDVTIQSKEDLRKAIKKNLARERNEAEIDKLTERIWNRMQTEDSGTSLPRKEGMEGFYGNPTDGSIGIVGGVAEKLFGQKVGTVSIDINIDKNTDDIYVSKEQTDGSYLVIDPISDKDLGKFKTELEAREYLQKEKIKRNTSTQHSIDITPELKQEAESGLPLFKDIKGRGKEIADLLRKGKIKASGLQSNIAGIPAALWNAAIDTIATAIEGGATLAQAIQKAIRDHKLNSQKGFDQREFISKLENATGEKLTQDAAKEPPKTPTEGKGVGEGGSGKRDLDKLANNVPETGKVAEYMSKDSIIDATGEAPTNDQKRGVQSLEIALEHGEKIIDKAKELYGDDYVEKTLDYIENSTAAVSNKALMYVSLENALGKEKLTNPDKAAEITKKQALVYSKSQLFARENSKALNYNKLRNIAKVGYDVSKITDSFFSADELVSKNEISKAIEADADTINKEAELQETGGITPEIEKAINEGVAKEVQKIYEALPKEKKTAADRAIAALEKAQAKLRNKTYDAGLGIPVAFIDAGITTIKLAIKAGVKIADAIELGIAKIKEKYGKEIEKEREDAIRKDLAEVFDKAKSTKDLVKTILIEKGFGRKFVKKGETKVTLDWKKLAGAAGTTSKISENVADALKDKGYSAQEVNEMKDALINEYIDLRASVIEKAQNELARRNKETVTPEQKTAAKKLAELYTYGLFDAKIDEFENTLNKALGAKVSERGFQEAKDIAKAMDTIYSSTFKGVRLSDISAKAAIEKLEDRMRVLLFREAKKQGKWWNLGAANLVRNYFEIQQTMLLNNLKQAMENPFSGLQQNLIDKMVASGASTSEMATQRRKMMKDVYYDMILKGGVGYGKVESQFVNRQHIDDYVNKLSDKKLYHGIASALTGKATLNAMDAMFKAGITEKKFAGNLIKILTHSSNPNKMTREEAVKFVSEKLTGQTFDEAKETAKGIIEKINEDAGKELVSPNEYQVNRFANDIVKSALEMGNKITKEQIEAAYNAAYKAAGLGLGHEANNILSSTIKGYSAKLEGDINRAIKDKEFNRAAMLTYKSILFRNVLNPFVGGGTNWLVLKLEKTGLGLFTGLAYQIGSKGRIDVGSEIGMKRLEARLYNQSRYKDNYMRGLVGGMTSLLVYAAFLQLADEDEYRKWRRKNKWAAKYLDVITPEYLLAEMAAKDGKVKQYAASSFNKNDAFDASTKIIKAIEYFSKGDRSKGWGAMGEAMGQKINAPLPWRLVKDGQVIYQGVKGQDPYHGNYQPSEGFLSGVLQGGSIEYLGYRPVSPVTTMYTPEDMESPEIKFFIDKDVKMPSPNIDSKEIESSDGKTLMKLKDADKATQEKYVAAYKKYLKEGLLELKKGYIEVYQDSFGRVSIPSTEEGQKGKETILLKDLDQKQLQSVVSDLGGMATKKASEEVFPKN